MFGTPDVGGNARSCLGLGAHNAAVGLPMASLD